MNEKLPIAVLAANPKPDALAHFVRPTRLESDRAIMTMAWQGNGCTAELA